MIWANFFHIYQPPNWDKEIIRKVVKESYRPFLSILKRNPKVKITLNINASLTEQLVKHGFEDVIEDIKCLAKKGQIEFTHSAKYHLILPLYGEEIVWRQIKLNEKINKKYLGKLYQPKGFFPPEMAWSKNLIPLLKKLKVEWVILDEIAHHQKIGEIIFDQGYKIKNTNIKVIFRNRIISDYFVFEADPENPDEFFEKVKNEGRSDTYLITAMDGENLGHHRPKIDTFWEKLVQGPDVETVNITELVKKYDKWKEVFPLASSWSSEPEDFEKKIPYFLWQNPKNQIHQKQWELTKIILELTCQAKIEKDKDFSKAEKLLDKALASDQFWWASLRPWWNEQIIIREAQELFNVLIPLKSISVQKKEKASKILQEIINIANSWQNSGKAEKMVREYLGRIGIIPHLGGEKIIK